MTNWRRRVTMAMSLLILGGAAVQGSPRAEDDETAPILSLDRQFWEAYNACDTEGARRFFTGDVEFYHDKGGAMLGRGALIEAIQRNLCSGSTRVRREAIEGTVHVFPLRRDGVLYGAILSGDHRFYRREADGPEALDGVAKFTHVWLLHDGTWRMARLLSYAHGPAPYVSTRKAVIVPDAVLDSLAGRYRTGQGLGTVHREHGALVLSFDEGSFTLHPESETLFFITERDLTFEFARRATDGARIMRVRENGVVVDEGVAEK